MGTHVGVNLIGKVEDSGTLGQFEEVALGRKDKDLVAVEVHLELVNQLLVAALVFECGTNVLQPVLELGTTVFHSFVTPMGSQSVLCHIVHSLGANLHFHPLAFGSHHRGVETLVAIGLGHRKPVA